MNIPIQDPIRQYYSLKKAWDAAVLTALKSGQWLFGKQVFEFEIAFANYCGTQHSISVANGTDALEIALLATGSKNREVITVANAGGYTTSACRTIGTKPVYVDVNPDDLLISVSAVLHALTPLTAAVVVTHLYGRIADINSIRKSLDSIGRQDVVIIEDCAQSHGGKFGDAPAGSLGELGTFSFYPTKNLGAMGDAGAVVCQNDTMAEKLKQLRQYGWEKRYVSISPYGRNSRMDEIQAAILNVKLQHLNIWNKKRRHIINQYKKFAPSPFSIYSDESEAFVGHLAIVRHPERDRVASALYNMGVTTDIHYPILDCDQQSQKNLPKVVEDLTNTREAVKEIFTLPCFPEMTVEEIAYVCERLSQL
jgi:aminotransferase EvaB